MFGELPKLFDRNFVIGFFLPVTLFIVFSIIIIIRCLSGGSIVDFLKPDVFAVLITTIALLSWIGGTILLALNREIYRLLEGYHRLNPLRLFSWMEKRRYRKLKKELEKLDDEFRQYVISNKEFPSHLRVKRNKVMRRIIEEFPDKEEFFLPTPFGNALRAFEVYPRVMYGVEGIDGWPRMLTVVPKEYRELIDDIKAQVDWWINLAVMSFLLISEFWIIICLKWGFSPGRFYTTLNLLIPLGIFIVINWLFLWRATSAAIGWGHYVKSAFDIYRFDLLDAFHIEPPKNREAERVLWTRLSQSIMYRRTETLPELKRKTVHSKKK